MPIAPERECCARRTPCGASVAGLSRTSYLARVTTQSAGKKKVVVIGGGVSGLATAHALHTQHGIDVTLLEAEQRLGGNVRTIARDGFLIDEGPDSWVANKPHATALCRAVGLGDHLIETIVENRRVFIRMDDGRLVPMPDGMMLGIPTRIWPLVTTPLLSWRGKMRAGLDLVLPIGYGKKGDDEDEPLGDFVERRLGREVLDKLAAPLLGGLFTGDVSTLSLLGSFPQMATLEKQYGGLIRGALATARKAQAAAKPGAPKPAPFLSLRGGIGELVDTLVARLGDAVVRGARVESVERDGDEYAVRHTAGEPIRATHVVIAGPAHVAAKLCKPFAEDLARELADIGYSSAATVFLGYSKKDIDHRLDSTGYLCPNKAPGLPLASTWVSSKWPFRAPEGDALIRIFFGEADVERSDDDLVERARREVAATLKCTAEPKLVHIGRFRRASPQPRVGHPARMKNVMALLAGVPNLHVLGSAYDGVGLGDCVRQAETIAGKIAT